MGAEPLAVFAAQGLGWKGQQHLLAQYVLQQDSILLIITDFGLGSGDGMLGSLAIGPGRPKKQVELTGKWMLDGVETPGAEDLEAAVVVRTHANIIDQLPRPAMLYDQVGTAVDGERVELANVESILDAAGRKGQIELYGFTFQINDGQKHGRGHRRMPRRVGLSYGYGFRLSPGCGRRVRIDGCGDAGPAVNRIIGSVGFALRVFRSRIDFIVVEGKLRTKS
jgi:hypothetical protein